MTFWCWSRLQPKIALAHTGEASIFHVPETRTRNGHTVPCLRPEEQAQRAQAENVESAGHVKGSKPKGRDSAGGAGQRPRPRWRYPPALYNVSYLLHE